MILERERKQTSQSYSGPILRPRESFQAMVQWQATQVSLCISLSLGDADGSQGSYGAHRAGHWTAYIVKERAYWRFSEDPFKSSGEYSSANSYGNTLGQGKLTRRLKKMIPGNHRGPGIICFHQPKWKSSQVKGPQKKYFRAFYL